jgi:large subunit ribosomal protein L11
MSKKVIAQIKLQLEAGKATPAPPLDRLSSTWSEIYGFCKQYNAEDF